MAGKYKLVRMPDLNKDGEQLPLHARLVSNGTITLKDMIEDITSQSSFCSGDVKGLLDVIQNVMVRHLMMGYNVDLEGIGTFTVSLQCRPVMDKKELRSESVHFRSVNYRPSVKLCNKLRCMALYRADEDKNKRNFTLEESRQRMINYLNRHGFIVSRNYMGLNHCCRAKACRELKQFRREGIIKQNGYGPATFYVLKEQIGSNNSVHVE